jgi:hypothetical protein
MGGNVLERLGGVLGNIDRPGTFCVSGSVPVVLPGLEVGGLGPVGLPLTASGAKELKEHCTQAPYGKGEQTLVDTKVRRVWRLAPDGFRLSNPDWAAFLRQAVQAVQQGLGLEDQKLEAHLYDLLLYEKGGFFLPHRDGEKLERMVATLVVVLPSPHEGGELVVRHDGQERVVDFGGAAGAFQTHFAAFYADCEHEVRPLRAGRRLCLVYNLTLKKGKKGLSAPRTSGFVAEAAALLRGWGGGEAAGKMAFILGHQYTAQGLAWDALKGADRVKAQVLDEAARQAGCRVHLALLTLHQTGGAEEKDGGPGWGDDGEEEYDEDGEGEGGGDDSSPYVMTDLMDTELYGEHWCDSRGNRLPVGQIGVDEGEVLDPESLETVKPEEDYEGYTGNEGMTLDRWYRRAALFVWPAREHFKVLCGAGHAGASRALQAMVGRWAAGGRKDAGLRDECVAFAAALVAGWPEVSPGGRAGKEPDGLLPALDAVGEPDLVRGYLKEVLARDATIDPGEALEKVCRARGWATFQPGLQAAFEKTIPETLERNVRLLESFCLARPPRKAGWAELCAALAGAVVGAFERFDREQAALNRWERRDVDRPALLASLARSLLAVGLDELLARVTAYALAHPKAYPLREAHVVALQSLQPWLVKHRKGPSAALAGWVRTCREQLEALTAEKPRPPADYRREANLHCKCADCQELKAFLMDPHEKVHSFRAIQDRRRHLEESIRGGNCDLDLRTDRKGSPHALVCIKNTASYEKRLQTYQCDLDRLKDVRAIEGRLPG